MKCYFVICLSTLVLFYSIGVAADDCPPNQHQDDCGTACPDNCDNYKDSERVCILPCAPGCVCNKGFIRRSSKPIATA
ncbi:hypothetical protein HNY73_004084 [Argiope bruennichi]|uniref:TIL domain-containing protein n=1 Tax=Argiope bruennichi TaxID=94029 RepID=A0A8T0FQ79_ARGBR|nr:hypothetical protein HNY73_004084 [Argiope bruennichi]